MRRVWGIIPIALVWVAIVLASLRIKSCQQERTTANNKWVVLVEEIKGRVGYVWSYLLELPGRSYDPDPLASSDTSAEVVKAADIIGNGKNVIAYRCERFTGPHYVLQVRVAVKSVDGKESSFRLRDFTLKAGEKAHEPWAFSLGRWHTTDKDTGKEKESWPAPLQTRSNVEFTVSPDVPFYLFFALMREARDLSLRFRDLNPVTIPKPSSMEEVK